MRHSYKVSFARSCPVDDSTIRYVLELWSHRKVLVEDIQAACVGNQDSIFQEDLATFLSQEFMLESGRLTATHNTVEIVSEWESP